MDTCSDPFCCDLVTSNNTIGYRDLCVGSSGGDDILTLHNRSATNKWLRVHTILDDCIFSIILVQSMKIATSLVPEVIVMVLQVLRGVTLRKCRSRRR